MFIDADFNIDEHTLYNFIAAFSLIDIAKRRGVGRKTINELIDLLDEYGLSINQK